MTNVNGKVASVFADTLDYIFFSSPGWRVCSVLPLPKLSEFPRFRGTAEPQPMPSENEPSDHLMLGATLAFEDTASPQGAM